MKTRRAGAVVAVGIAALSLFAFDYVARRLSAIFVGLSAYEEVQAQLHRSLDDQKTLAALDPQHAAQYRARFDATAALLGHLRVVQVSRRDLARNVEQILLGSVALILFAGAGLYYLELRGRERHHRRRLLYLEHLSAWQESARRHAHEIRTPLAAARMEVDRFAEDMRRRMPDAAPDIERAQRSILEEIDCLRDFTRSFTSFATIAQPRTRRIDLAQFLADFCTTFAGAWPNARLVFDAGRVDTAVVEADGEMLRQVLVNLAGNSALAFGANAGTIELRLKRAGDAWLVDVADDGPGVDPAIRARLFEPYTTTRGIGEGMGLGLAISKKIMLDHGGDLELIPSRRGAAFRLAFPAVAPS